MKRSVFKVGNKVRRGKKLQHMAACRSGQITYSRVDDKNIIAGSDISTKQKSLLKLVTKTVTCVHFLRVF